MNNRNGDLDYGISNPAYSTSGGENEKQTKNGLRSSINMQESSPEESQECKFLGLVPLPFCRRFLSAKWMLLFLCWAATIQGMTINGFINVVISTLEKRFGFQSSTSGWIAGIYDIGSLLAVIPVTYFGGRLGSSKPRYIAMGLFIMGCGSLMFTIPHFNTDRYNPPALSNDTNRVDYCVIEESDDDDMDSKVCDEAQLASALANDLSNYKYLFLLGQFLHGVGASPLITLGTTLLDESVPKHNSPLYIAIFQTMFVVGPAMGYILGGRLLAIYTDIDVLEPGEIINLTPKSPLWIGAWWAGFVLSWVSAWTASIFMFSFPASLPGAGKHNQVTGEEGFNTISELPKAIKALLTNWCFVMIMLGGAMDGFSVAGMSTFMPKFIQSQYGLTSGVASIILGAIVVPAGGIGTFLGGFITKRLKLTRSGVIRMYILAQAITIPAAFSVMFYCPNSDFNGVTVPYSEVQVEELRSPISNPVSNFTKSVDMFTIGELGDTCNAQCACRRHDYDPVCGSDSQMYFNPCYAGCLNKITDINGTVNFEDCGCIQDQVKTAEKGRCESDCNNMIGFIIFIFISIFFTFMSAMPNIVATLRAVEPVHRSLALGIESIVLRLLGTIPGPVIYGALIDNACLLWSEVECSDSTGNCLVVDNWKMAYSLLITNIIIKFTGCVLFAGALYFSNRSPIKDDPNEEVG